MLLGQGRGPVKPDPAKATATLRLTVDPPTAKITVDGEPSTGDVTGLTRGATVKVVAVAPDYVRYEELIKLDEADKILSIKLDKEGKPHQVVVRPSDPDATVYVNGERLGKGSQSFSGMVGDEVVVKVQPAGDGAKAVVKSIVLSEDQAIVDVSVTTPAVLTITVTPMSAALSSDLGSATKHEQGLWSVSGLEVGQTVGLTTKASGFRTDKRRVELTETNQTHTIKLDKVALPKGKIRVWAKPWAQISVDGRAQGTTPRTIDNLKGGPHTVVLTRGSQKITKRVQVRPGKTIKVGHDFTK
ncbi:MAG: hypothetical protein CSA66_08110 [Proteobacteria bacterium]|nr:MAG: hypothetical protein CSA66_08110 [Pseudomonadota bacterium]